MPSFTAEVDPSMPAPTPKWLTGFRAVVHSIKIRGSLEGATGYGKLWDWVLGTKPPGALLRSHVRFTLLVVQVLCRKDETSTFVATGRKPLEEP